jgi:type IV pilus assembly protein PilE
MRGDSGFSLVELMVVVAIMAILASVSIPAYINYKNRSIQSEAVEALQRANMDQGSFWAEHNRYAGTIGLLASFGNTSSVTSYPTPNLYRISITHASATGFGVLAARTIHGQANTLSFTVTPSTQFGTMSVSDAGLGYSVFKWIFE